MASYDTVLHTFSYMSMMASQTAATMYICATIAIIIVSCHNIALVCVVVAAVAVFTKLNAAASLAISYCYYYYCCCLPKYSIGVHNATTQGNRSMRTIATTIAYSLSLHCVLLQHAFTMTSLRAAAEHERFTHYLRMQTIVTETCLCYKKTLPTWNSMLLIKVDTLCKRD
jgi:hypothetical protein